MPIPRCLFRFVLAACTGAALLAPAFAAAQAPVWQPLGPFGGQVASLTADPVQPGVLYAAAGSSGVFKSTDRGISWRNVLASAGGGVAVDPVQPAVLYAISPSGAMWKSRDGGTSWAPIGQGLPTTLGRTHSVTVDPARRTRLYLASGVEVWRSLNGGGSWQSASNGLPTFLSSPVEALLAVRSPEGTAFAGTRNSLYRTTNGGDSWQRLSQGLPPGRVTALAASPADPKTLYVLFFHGSVLFRSTNGGTSWKQVTGPPAGANSVTSLAADPRSPSILYATLSNGNVLRSANGAKSWSLAGKLPGTSPVDLTPDPFAAGVLYAGLTVGTTTTPGVFRSDDRGATWQRRVQGYHAYDTVAVSVAPGSPPEAQQVWTATTSQAFRSGNGGRRWAQVKTPANKPILFAPFALAVGDSSTAFALTFTNQPYETLAWRTEDAGTSWQPVSPPSNPPIAAFRLAPTEVFKLYALHELSSGFNVLRTANDGNSWETLATGLDLRCGLGDLALAPSTGSVLYVTGAAADPVALCNAPAVRVLRSQDGGTTWTNASAGLPPGRIARVSVDPDDPDVIYAGYGQSFTPRVPPDGVWKSTDGGATWKRAGTGLAGQEIAVLLTTAAGRVYAVRTDSRVFHSENGGESWEDVSLPTSRVHALASDPFSLGRVYAATSSGVWVLEED